jgi:hypothetical protein
MIMATVLGVTMTHAQESNKGWSLATDDTKLTVQVASNHLSITSLKPTGQGWEWMPSASAVPMPGKDSVKAVGKNMTPQWVFQDAVESKTNGHLVVLRFTNSEPALELKSYWQALPGPGPVENWAVIENKSTTPVAYQVVGMPAAAMKLRAEKPVRVHRAAKTAAGTGRVAFTPLEAGGKVQTGTGELPFVLLDVEARHGLYLGFEWELGGFNLAAGSDPLDIAASVHPLTHAVERGPGERFEIPSVYYGVYRGDIDDGANRFKRWFWNHKITRSLHDNPDEPWVEMCMGDVGGSGHENATGATPQSTYDRIADTGAECVKLDFWDGSGQCWYTDRDWQYKAAVWPNGFDFATKARKAGLKASLYMGGTYLDGDLNTTEARDRQLAALLKRYDEGWFDMWRTDRYTAPQDPMPSTYQGIHNFQYIVDHLIANRPGFRYENCANGGKFKGFNICRRMTFCTMNDKDKEPWLTRSTYYSDTFAINPVQLKSDLGPASHPYYLRTDMLGAILTWGVDNPVYREHIALYKARHRPILRGGNVYHILPMPDGKNWDGLQFHNPDLDRGSVFVFKPSDEVPESQPIKLRGLLRDKTYRVAFQDAKERSCTMTGAQLMDEGLTLTLKGKEASEIIWLNCTELSATPQVLVFTEADNAAAPAPQRFTIVYQYGPGTDKAFTVTAVDPWLKVKTLSGSGNGQVVEVSVVPGQQPPGVHRSRVVVSRADLSDRVTVSVEWRHAMTQYARWTLDEKDGEAVTDAWGKHAGKIIGGATRVPGKIGGALHFNGKDQYVQMDTILDDLKQPCTFVFWVKPDAAQGAHADIFGNHVGSTRGVVMQQEGSEANKYSFGYGSTPAPGGAGPVQLKADAWQHVAVVCDGKEVVIYVDGKETARGAGTNPLTPNPQLGFRLASGFAEGRFFAGALDDFRIYGRVVSMEEIRTLSQE